ncbi:MAG: hypothetical protein R3327_02370 [Nitrosopumilaceae archaeon]|nr:hypothetical protein [Nitrosopumilaceae archaeon]
MSKPEVVPDKISNPINFYVIIGILVVGAGIFVAFQFLPEEETGMLAFILSVGFASGAAAFAFFVAKRAGLGVISKAYLSLALGFTAYVIAELLYYTFDLVLGIEPYPSVADIFFFALYPFTLGHLLLNMSYFHTGYTIFQKIWIPAIPVFAIFIYIIMSLSVPDAELNFDFYYGLIFVAAAATTFSFTVMGTLTFKSGALGVVWLLLLIGLMVNAAGDVWYYHLEIFGQYYDAHPVTVVWYVANMFIIYALFKHIKII